MLQEVQSPGWRWLLGIPPCLREDDTSPYRLMYGPAWQLGYSIQKNVGKENTQICRHSEPNTRFLLKYQASFTLCAFSRLPYVQSTRAQNATCHLGFETGLTSARLKWFRVSWRLLTQPIEGTESESVKGHGDTCFVF